MKQLIIINAIIVIASVVMMMFLRKSYESYVNSDSKPQQINTKDVCRRKMTIGQTEPSFGKIDNVFEGAECSPACCMHSPYSCDKGCVCINDNMRAQLSDTYAKYSAY